MKKRPYAAPSLVDYGKVRSLTAGGTSVLGEDKDSQDKGNRKKT